MSYFAKMSWSHDLSALSCRHVKKDEMKNDDKLRQLLVRAAHIL